MIFKKNKFVFVKFFLIVIFFLNTKKIFAEIKYEDFADILQHNQKTLELKIKEIYKTQLWQVKGRKVVTKPTTIDKLQNVYTFLIKQGQVLNDVDVILKTAIKKINSINQQNNIALSNDVLTISENLETDILKKIISFSENINNTSDFNSLKNLLDNKSLLLSFMPQHYALFLNTQSVLYKLQSYNFLTQEKYLNLKNYLETNFQDVVFSNNLENFINKLITVCSSISKTAASEINIENSQSDKTAAEILTYTIRCKDGLVLIFADENTLLKVKNLLKNIPLDLGIAELKQKILISEPNVSKVENFYSSENPKMVSLNSMPLRAAEFSGLLPCLENLPESEAKKLLKALKLNAYFVSFESKEVLQNILPELDEEFIILEGTDFNSLIYVAQ